jgi:hypothetical protein
MQGGPEARAMAIPQTGTRSARDVASRAGGAVWRNRFRLAAALAVSLAGHAWLAGGLARMPLRLANDEPAPAVEEPRIRPVPRDFALSPPEIADAPAAHERPLDRPLDPLLSPAASVAAETAAVATLPPLAVVEEVVPLAAAPDRPTPVDGLPALAPPIAPQRAAAAPPAEPATDTPLDLPVAESAAETAPALRPIRRQPSSVPTAAETALAAPLPLVVREGAPGAAGVPADLAPRVSRRGPTALPEAVVGGPPGRSVASVTVTEGVVAALPPAAGPPSAAADDAATPGGTLAALGMRPAIRPARPSREATAGTVVSAPPGLTAGEEPLSVESTVSISRPGEGAGEKMAVVAQPMAALQRGAAVVLPPEGRVRSIARPYAPRSPERRGEAPIDRVVERGLAYLARSQRADGSWSLAGSAGEAADNAPKLRSDTAATGLALLSFLGAGYDHFDGPHHESVRRGLEWLMRVQKPDGDLYIPSDPLSDSCAWLYSHAIATMALCEAVGMTGDPLIRPAAVKACGFIAASQHPERGGWRYTPRSDADLSVSGWMLVALRSGQLAGIAVDPAVLERVRTLLMSSTVAVEATAPADITTGRYLYNIRNPQQRPAQLSTACMTALGTLMRLHTGTAVDDPAIRAAATALASFEPAYGTRQDRRRDAYLWYYASQVLVHTGGEQWDRWYAALCRLLDSRQERNGPLAGSWDPLGSVPDRWGGYGGRVYVTALHLLALEVPYRHLPTYDLDPGAGAVPGVESPPAR